MVDKVLVDVTSTVVSEADTASTTIENTGDGETVPISAIVIDENEIPTTTDTDHTFPNLNAVDDIELKKEEVEEEVKKLLFSETEDSFLRAGVVKYASSSRIWADILKDDEYKFHSTRTRDTIRMRATTMGIGKKKTKNKSQRK